MQFRVQPADIDGYAKQISRSSDDATSIKNYLASYKIDGGWESTVIQLLAGSHMKSMDAARTLSDTAATTLHNSGTGLTSTATYYRTTDSLAAAHIDTTLPGAKETAPTTLEQRWHDNVCGPSFADSREPGSHLKTIEDVEYDHPLSILDYISISDWALKGFDFVFGFNPLDKVSDHFIGDWQAVAKGGKAIGNAADAHDDLAYNIQGGAIALHSTWNGNAADAAYGHFTGTASKIGNAVNPLREIAKQFDQVASAVYQISQSITGWIKGMIDAAIIAGIAAAAGTITAVSGVGAIVGYGVATVEVANLLKMWAQMTAAMTNLYTIVQASVGIIATQIAAVYDAKLPDAGGFTAYQPAVAPR